MKKLICFIIAFLILAGSCDRSRSIENTRRSEIPSSELKSEPQFNLLKDLEKEIILFDENSFYLGKGKNTAAKLENMFT